MSDDNLYESFYGSTIINYNPYDPYEVGKHESKTGTTVNLKRLTQLDEDIIRLTQLDEDIIRLSKQIKELEALNRIQENLKQVKNLPKSKAYSTLSDKEKYDKIRQEIRKGATFIDDMSAARKIANIPGSSTRDVKSSPQIINEVVVVDKVEFFTDQTHGAVVRFINNDYYSEQIETKVVGMEQVDWWEYVLIYGIFKALKISFEYTKLKEIVNRGMKSNRKVSGKLLEINLVPRKKFDATRTIDTLNGKSVIRETGTKYESALFVIEVPQNKVRKTQEYKKGFFIFEDTFDTLEVDYNKLLHDLDEILIKNNIHESFKMEIKKNIINNGRLSGV
jgi:hypothetical protein